MTLFDTIKGAFEGAAEGGIVGAIAGAIKGLFNSLIFGPLDMIKGAISWVLGFFGMDRASAMLDSFSFADLFSSLIDGIAGFVQHIANFIGNIIMAPIRPIMELFNSLMGIFTNADGEGIFKNVSDSAKPKFEIVIGKSNRADANIAGITPAVFIFKGK